MRYRILSLIILLGLCAGYTTSEEKIIMDIETMDQVTPWWFDTKNFDPEVTSDVVLAGTASLKTTPGAYIVIFPGRQISGDWSGYDALQVDFDNQTGKPQSLSILIGDKDYKEQGNNYWNRHNSNHIIPVGRYTFTLPITGLYRGEAGSRYNQLKYPIKPGEIVRFDMGIGNKKDAALGPVYMDNIRVVSTKLPEYIKAFDFGPQEQSLQMGWTPVTWNTNYDPEKGYGFSRHSMSANRARDDTFPPGAVYRDWVITAEGWEKREFKVDVPNGTYHVYTCFSDPGYWGGEAIRHTKRAVKAEGAVMWEEDLSAWGKYGKPDYFFENTEPKIGDDFWDLYMQKIYAPIRFTVKVDDGQLNIAWDVNDEWSCKTNSIVVYPDTNKADGDAFVQAVIDREHKAFSIAAQEHKPEQKNSLDAIPAAEKDKGYVFFLTDYTQDTYQNTIPKPGQIQRTKTIAAARGEWEPVTFAIRPLKDLGAGTVTVSDFKGPAGTLPADIFDIRIIRHLSRRGFSAINYIIVPMLLKRESQVDLVKDLTREFVVWARIPEDAADGNYAGTISLSASGVKETLQVSLTIHPFTLDGSDYTFSFFGNFRDESHARLLRDLGFNSFGGGPQMVLKGFTPDGQPDMNFDGVDKYMAMMKRAGYTQEAWAYGGMTIQHVGYTKDENFFNKWEQETGLGYDELLKRVFATAEAHAKEKEWLPMVYGMVDETRNVEMAKKQVAQITAVGKATDWIKTGGSYSVGYDKGEDPKDYHQWIFMACETSSLNNHDMGVMKKAKELGKLIYIYNQGLSRYSFGAYQWSEYQKGVYGRQQWHLHVQHGYQFFDLDGREPDTASVLFYGKDEPIPSINLLRSAEGADDFYYCQTLHNLCEKAKAAGKTAEAAEARTVLDEIESKIKINEKRKPAWLDNNKLRADCTAAILKLQGAKAPEAAPPAEVPKLEGDGQTAPAEAAAEAGASPAGEAKSVEKEKAKSKGCGAMGFAWMAVMASLFLAHKRRKRFS